MSTTTSTRTNRLLIGAVAAIGVLAGAAGIASAVTGTDQGPGGGTHVVAARATSDDVDRDDNERDDIPEGDGRDDDRGDDDLTADQAGAAQEAAAITRPEAERVALARAPGTVHDVDLEDEHGTVVWDVEVDGRDGRRHDLQIDAATGTVVEHDIHD